MNEQDWTTWRVRGRIYEVWSAPDGQVVILGVTDDEEGKPEEQRHNCDANGCGQDHVLWRGRIERGRRKVG